MFILDLLKEVTGLEITMLVIVKVTTQDSKILIYKFSPKGMIIQSKGGEKMQKKWRRDCLELEKANI